MLNRPWWKREVRFVPRWIRHKYRWVGPGLATLVGLAMIAFDWWNAINNWSKFRWYNVAGTVGWTVGLGLCISFLWYVYLVSFHVRRAIGRRWQRCCLHCGYDLRGLTSSACPECGREYPETARRDVKLRLADTGRSKMVAALAER